MRIPNSNRGSVLIVAAIFSTLIAIALASYLQLSRNSMKLANRSFYSNAAMDLTDAGLEQAMWGMNNNNLAGGGFTQVTGNPAQWQGTFPAPTTWHQFLQGVKGQTRVWLDQTNAGSPHAVAMATITLGDGSTFMKEAEIYLGRRSYFANGLVAKQTITFSGNNASVDSWNSDPDNTPSTPAIPYSSTVARDNGMVGSTSVQIDAINVSNADIYGFAAVGGTSLNDIQVGPNGLVGPYGTANGTIDTTHVTYDFTTNFPDVSAPSLTEYNISAIGGATTLPRAGDIPAADGSYYYNVPSISLSGNGATLSISGSNVGVAKPNVVIVVTNTLGNSVSTTGQGGIRIDIGASLAMYTSGNVSIAGNGVMNGTNATPNQPVAFQLYGTLTAAQAAADGMQTISVAGNGVLSGVVYAPNANTSFNGGGNNGQVLGAMVANSVTITGNSAFHYDESLANFGGSKVFAVTKWRELSSASDRAAYASNFNF